MNFDDLFGAAVPKANVADWLQQARQHKHRCVYILECKSSYKIGRTENLTKRLKSLQIGNPFAMKIAHVIFTEEHVKVEQALHRIFLAARTRDEWFSLSLRDLAVLRSMSGRMIGMPHVLGSPKAHRHMTV